MSVKASAQGYLPPLEFDPLDGVEVREISPIAWLLATGQALPSLETMWVATVPAEMHCE